MHTLPHLAIAFLQNQLGGVTPPVNSDNESVLHHMSSALHESFFRVLGLLTAVLPGVLALFVALIVFSVIGMGISALLRRALTWVRFDERLTRNRANWAPSSSPTELAGRLVFWVCVLLGLVIGVSAFDVSYASASNLPIQFLPYLTRAISALIVLLVGTLLARFLARSVLISAVNAQLHYARILSLGVKWLVLVLTAAMVLDHLQIGGGIVDLAFGILFGGIVLALSLAIGLGSRDLVTRSLENQLERSSDRTPGPPGSTYSTSEETIRHF